MCVKTEVVLTEIGRKKCNAYIEELKAKRKEILDVGKDTVNNTKLPTIDDICCDIAAFEEDGEYCNNWGVTDNYDGDYPLFLVSEKDFIVKY